MSEKPGNKKGTRIILLSDGTGETGYQMIQAAMVQFPDYTVQFTRYKNVRSEAQIEAICQDAAVNKDLIVFTLVSPQLRTYLLQKGWEHSIPTVDLLGPLLVGMASYFGYEPKLIAGLLRNVNETYFNRIDAMEYTISHDDGKDLRNLDLADLVILGISRTSKTPISMYLSHHGWRVCNIPLILGFDVPKEVFQIDQKKVIGLTIDPPELATIRRARLQKLGQNNGGDYADLEKINAEIEHVNEIYRKNRKWAIFNVTGKAIEETASEIIKLMTSRKIGPSLLHK